MSAKDDEWPCPVAKEPDLLFQQPAFCSRGSSCMDVRRRAGEHEAYPDARRREHGLKAREGFRVRGSEVEVPPGPATGVFLGRGI
jgi:hypothetical protein